jgi:hypothetical protein
VSTGFCFHFVPISSTSNLISLLAKFRFVRLSKLVLCAPVVLNILFLSSSLCTQDGSRDASGLNVRQVLILYTPRTAGPNYP